MEWPEAAWIEEGDGLAALAPRLVRADGVLQVSWREASHERVIECALVDESQAPDRIVFEDARGRRWVFRELTLERYERHVRSQTIGAPAFVSQAAMLSAMRAEW